MSEQLTDDVRARCARGATNLLWASTPPDEYLLELYGPLVRRLIRVRAKQPLEKEWQKQPERRLAQCIPLEQLAVEMAAWLDESDENQIGLIIAFGTSVLDGDSREAAEQLEEQSPLGVAVQQTARGAHLMYRVSRTAEIPGRCKLELAPGLVVDVRAAGKNFIVCEPSLHHELGTPYTWSSRIPRTRAELPPLLSAWLQRIALPTAARTSRSATAPFSGGGTISQGARNRELFRRACALQRQGLSDSAIHAATHAENLQCCMPPFVEREVETIIASALRYAKGRTLRTIPLKVAH